MAGDQSSRVAEENWKLEEKEHQRWEAEHCAEAVHQVQAPESPMQIDDESGDDRDAEEEMEKKGKGKEKNGWEIVRGSGRCNACQEEETACKIYLVEIERWWKSTEKGKVYKKAPPSTSCQRCMEVRQKPCILPAVAECQWKMEKPGKLTKLLVVPSTSLGRKRPWKDVGYRLPPMKRQRQMAEEEIKMVEGQLRVKEMLEGQFRAEMVKVLGWIDVWLKWQVSEAEFFTKVTELQNILLQHLVVVLEGQVAACRSLPDEGKLLTEDEAE